MLTEMLTVDLLWSEWPEAKDQGLYLAPCYDDIPALGEDEKLRGEIEMQKAERMIGLLQGGVMTLNEVREELELETIKDPRADDVFLITGGEQPAEDAPADAPASASLNQTGLSTIRQVSTSYSKGDIGDEQAVQLLRLAKPEITDAELKALLIPPAPVEPEPEEAPAEPEVQEPTDTAPALEILTAWSEGTISDEAAAVLLREAMPTATDTDIAALLTEPEPVEDDAAEGEDMGEDMPTEDAPEETDDDITGEVDALLEEAGGVAGKAYAVKVVDKDGDGVVFDGTPQERPARPEERAGNRRVDKANKMIADAKGKKKKGKGKKSEAQKEKEKAEKKAKKDAERVAKLEEEEKALRTALIDLQGKDDPSNLRKRISQALERIAARIESIKSGSSAGTSKLLGEANRMSGGATTDTSGTRDANLARKALPIFDFVGMAAVTVEGIALGTIEKIHRFGDHEGITATKAEPVVIVDGKAHRASALRVVLNG
jgi:hypothetical protein